VVIIQLEVMLRNHLSHLVLSLLGEVVRVVVLEQIIILEMVVVAVCTSKPIYLTPPRVILHW
jgi:hypothetical protein